MKDAKVVGIRKNTDIDSNDLDSAYMYNGNPNIKADGVIMEYTFDQKKEFFRCCNDIGYFIEKYCKVMTLDHGFTNIELRDYQRRYFDFLEGNRFSVVKWPRQAGKTTTSVMYILWKILFTRGQVWYFLANKLDTAREAFSRLKDAYESLPFWLQCGVKKLNETKIELSNGSKVTAAASSKSAIRGRSGNIMWDEAAFVQHDEEFYTSIFPVISSGKNSQFIMISTPNGMSNTFYRTYNDAVNNRGEFKLMEINWDEIPGRDEAWKKKMIETLGIEKFEQEFMTSFMAADGTLVPLHILSEIQIRAPLRHADYMAVFEEPIPDHRYVMTVDVARGIGKDFSVFSILDCTHLPYRQVLVYRNNNIAPMALPYVIDSTAKKYNNAHVLIEINDMGGQVADILHNNLTYENILWVGSGGRAGQVLGSSVDTKPGIKTTPAVKMLGCSNLRALFENKKIEIYDTVTFTELTSFVAKNGSYEGENGSHDDHVMTLVLFAWMIEQKYFMELFSVDTRKHMVEGKLKTIEEDLSEVGVLFISSAKDEYVMSSGGVIDYDEMSYKPRDEISEWFLRG